MTNPDPTRPYHLMTARGREAQEDSLQQAVASAAFLHNIASGTITCQPEDDPRTWYVYRSQASLDADLERGPINQQSPGWFAIVRYTGPRA